MIQGVGCKDWSVWRCTVEDVVDAAEDRPVLEARVRHHQVELAVRSHVGWPGGNQILRIRTCELPGQRCVKLVVCPVQGGVAFPAREAAAERLCDGEVVTRTIHRRRARGARRE